jgi:hypothetical protein
MIIIIEHRLFSTSAFHNENTNCAARDKIHPQSDHSINTALHLHYIIERQETFIRMRQRPEIAGVELELCGLNDKLLT